MPTPEEVIKQQERMVKIRDPYRALKELCIVLSNPARSDQYDFYAMFNDKARAGRPNTTVRRVYDPTAFGGLDIWGNGIMGNYAPEQTPWFMGLMADRELRKSSNVRKFLQETDEHLRDTLNNSNYYEQKRVTITDSASAGDSYMFIDEDEETKKIMCMVPHPREFWVERDFWGRVRIIHHEFNQSVRDVEQEFGSQALNEDQRLAVKTSPDQDVRIVHGIYKNKNFEPGKIGTKNMKWQHFYVNRSSVPPIEMRQTGTDTINPIPWALNRPSHEVYGRGIVSKMLIEILTANFTSKDMLIAGGAAARPPMLMTAALKHKLDMGQGSVNFVGNKETQGLKMGDLVARLVDSSGYPFGQDTLSRWQQTIDERFGVPLFLGANLDQVSKTLGEVRLRQAERVTMMGPFLGALGVTTDAELDRVYSIEEEAGRVPPVPEEVLAAQNRRIDINYIGPLSQLLKQNNEINSLLLTIEHIRAVLEIAPDSSVVYDGDELMRQILESSNTPEDIINSPELVEEIKAIAQQEQDTAIAAQMLTETSKAVPNLSGPVDSESVLNSIREAA